MKTSSLIVVCITLLLFSGLLMFFIWSEDISETPYEQCLETCEYSSKIDCVRYCNEAFKEAIEMIVNKLAPLIERVIENMGELK